MDFQRLDRVKGLTSLLAVPVVAILLGWWNARPAAPILQGEIDARQIDVAAKVPGRLAALLVKEGEPVTQGQLLASLDSAEIQAKVAQARGASAAASAQNQKAQQGARSEEIQQAKDLWMAAEADATIADKTYRRIARLYNEGIIPAQKRDEAQAMRDKARMGANAAKSRFEMATSGARVEDKEAAAGLASQAKGAVSEAESYLNETRVMAPLAGDVVECLADPGEVVPAGYPIISLLDTSDSWATFNVREDRLAGLKNGDRFEAELPALKRKGVVFEVTYISVLADFATWKSTNAQGDFDLKTFEVRAKPVETLEGLRPGMSVIWRPKK